MKETRLILDHIDDGRAVLKSEKGEKVIWPQNMLPEETKDGEAIVFKVSRESEKEKHDRGVARNILNEILNTEQ